MLKLQQTDTGRTLTIKHELVGDIELTLPPDLPDDDPIVDHPDNQMVLASSMLLHFVWLFLKDAASDDIEGMKMSTHGIQETVRLILNHHHTST